MKYSTTLIVLSLVNFIVIFSGFPTSWKKFLITITSILILLIGWILRALAIKKQARAEKKASEINQQFSEPIKEIVEELAEDVTEQVEHEIEKLDNDRY